MALLAQGQLLQVKREIKRGDNGPYEKVTLGISMEKPDGFKGEYETISLSMIKSQLDEGLDKIYEKLEGKHLLVPFTTSTTEFNGNKYFNMRVAGAPDEFQPELKKSS